jgi:hypothetical protein
MEQQQQLQECKTCLFDSEIAEIGHDGICNYCKLQDELAAQAMDFKPVLNDIRQAGAGKQYDCLIGISGGADSSILLYMAVKYWRLRPLVIHMNNRWNNAQAEQNMKVICEKLNVNSIVFYLDKTEYDNLNDAFLGLGLPDADIPNDIAMAKIMLQTADQYGIKYILNGHDFKREGSTPAKWTYMDSKYLESVYTQWTGKRLKNYPLLTVWDQIMYGLKGIKQVRAFHYQGNSEDDVRTEVMNELIAMGWQSYGEKHCENIYTEFIGAHLLPGKFGIDKRRVYLSAQIREGLITKEYAKESLRNTSKFDLDKLGKRKEDILRLTYGPVGKRSDYDHYEFRKWRLVIWALTKMKLLPYTFYKKYCLKNTAFN